MAMVRAIEGLMILPEAPSLSALAQADAHQDVVRKAQPLARSDVQAP